MLESEIKSRPKYPGLKPDLQAKQNLMVADAGGSEAIADLAKKVDQEFLSRTTVILCRAGGNGTDPLERLKSLGITDIAVFPTIETAISRLDGVLDKALMSTRLYVAGTEPLIGLVEKTAMAHGVGHSSIYKEHRGSLKRRVQCVHCKGITENVTTNPVICAHCGYSLLVRDHYSRRHAAFQGVRIDADAPGNIPEEKADYL